MNNVEHLVVCPSSNESCLFNQSVCMSALLSGFQLSPENIPELRLFSNYSFKNIQLTLFKRDTNTQQQTSLSIIAAHAVCK